MHSFRASHNQIQWKLVVCGEIEGRHPFQRSFPVIVRPVRASLVTGGHVTMNEPEVIIRLDESEQVYSPGTTLSGEYRIEGADGQEVQAIEISVLWYSEGKGDEDLAIHEFWRKNADSGELGDCRRPDRFSTTLPQSPLSYDGQIVKIRWCVRVRVIFKRGRDVLAQKIFRLGNVPPAKCAVSVNHAVFVFPTRSDQPVLRDTAAAGHDRFCLRTGRESRTAC